MPTPTDTNAIRLELIAAITAEFGAPNFRTTAFGVAVAEWNRADGRSGYVTIANVDDAVQIYVLRPDGGFRAVDVTRDGKGRLPDVEVTLPVAVELARAVLAAK